TLFRSHARLAKVPGHGAFPKTVEQGLVDWKDAASADDVAVCISDEHGVQPALGQFTFEERLGVSDGDIAVKQYGVANDTQLIAHGLEAGVELLRLQQGRVAQDAYRVVLDTCP
ncbi:MAG TPA: hypothetical protein DC084_32865, partial [Cupriavidus sp.]|nr:hypothetical protein [Cupriavidus sp.]